MDSSKMDLDVRKSIEAILGAINSQRTYQGVLFGNSSRWATIKICHDYGADISLRFGRNRSIGASSSDIRKALRMLQATESFNRKMTISYITDDEVEIRDTGCGLLEDIRFHDLF